MMKEQTFNSPFMKRSSWNAPERKTLKALKIMLYLLGCTLVFMIFVNLVSIVKVLRFSALPSIGVVDTKALVRFEAEAYAKQLKEKPLSEEKLEQIAERLKERLVLFAQKEKVLLFPKGAVLGGTVSDYTEGFLEALQASAPVEEKP